MSAVPETEPSMKEALNAMETLNVSVSGYRVTLDRIPRSIFGLRSRGLFGSDLHLVVTDESSGETIFSYTL